MNLTENMLVVLQAIWELRAVQGGQRVKLKSLEVERLIAKILGESRKPIARQNWYNADGKPEWLAIRRAIDGLVPLKGHEDVEKAIASFGAADKRMVIVSRVAELQAALDECKNKIKEQSTTFENFKLKAYGDQYVEGRFREEYEHYKQKFENYMGQAAKEETLRKQLDSELSKLRIENKDLRRLTCAGSNAIGHGNALGKHKLFMPDTGKISVEGSDLDLMGNYRTLKTEAFQTMLKEAERKPPDEIFLVFHQFNIDLPKFIQTELPYPQDHLTYVFACYEPISEKRNAIFVNAAKKTTLKPRVFLVLGERTISNVIQLQATPEVEERLRVKAKASIFRSYDFEEEQYEQICIKRT